MYLSVDNCFQLDRIVKTFEVAYRSYVANKLLNKFPDEKSFNNGFSILFSNTSVNSIIGTSKIRNKLKKIVNSKKTQKELYQEINYCVECLKKKDYGHKNSDVLYVSEIIDFVFFFFQTDFIELKDDSDTIEEFQYNTIKYLTIRNVLSHPASSRISYKDMDDVCIYIKKIVSKLDDMYFWYKEKNFILKQIDILYSHIHKTPFKINNFDEIPFTSNKIVCREEQISLLKNYLIGKDGNFRRSGSVVVYGYGGVGKTALILEFLTELSKDIIDNNVPKDYNPQFLLFFTAKEEKMSFSETTGDLFIEPLKKQVDNFQDLKTRLFSLLHVSNLDELVMPGIIVIDNVETFSQEDRRLLIDFIRNSPRTIQYILTSRNEERCEDRIYLHEFDKSGGREFIDKYIEENDLNVVLNDYEKDILIDGSRGNTLILVLSLKRLDIRKTTITEIDEELISRKIVFDSINKELKSVSSQNLETIANFMYKNTFEQTLDEMKKLRLHPDEVLKVISLYNEPVDLFSISTLSGVPLSDTEKICNILSQKLVLEKNGELYQINEFANKYVLTKFIPNLYEQKKLKNKINENKKDIRSKIKMMEDKIENVPLLKTIMNDWKPKNYIDKIAISQVFNLYEEAKKIAALDDKNIMLSNLISLEKNISEYELMTSHPYIRYQKARIFKLFLGKLDTINGRDIKKLINEYFEQTIISVEYGYGFMKHTKSYASVLWLFGMFHFNNRDYTSSVKWLEESKAIFENIQMYDKNYQKAVLKLCEAYLKMMELTGDSDYIKFAEKEHLELNKKRVGEVLKKYNMIVGQKIKVMKNSRSSLS